MRPCIYHRMCICLLHLEHLPYLKFVKNTDCLYFCRTVMIATNICSNLHFVITSTQHIPVILSSCLEFVHYVRLDFRIYTFTPCCTCYSTTVKLHNRVASNLLLASAVIIPSVNTVLPGERRSQEYA